MLNLFLDANVLLDFYRYGQDDLAEVQKLIGLINDKEVRLFSNSLLRDEVERSREAEIASSFNKLKSQKYSLLAPNYCDELDELNALKELLKEANKAHSKMMDALSEKISSKSLAADKLIKALFGLSENIEVSAEVLAASELRLSFNNPPRKRKDSIGDALHWECLLRVKSGYNFHIVTRDGDFASELEPRKIKDFLVGEWKKHHGGYSNINLHSSLGEFFREEFPQIKLSEEAEKNSLISQLSSSPNFSTTHRVIAELSDYDFFTRGQVLRLFETLSHNSQVSWIATDDDVHEFFMKLKDQAWLVPDEMQAELADTLEVEKEEFFRIPF